MMIMGTPPNAAGTQSVDAKRTHQNFGHPRSGQNRVVLLIMINDEKTQNEKPAQDTADEFCRRVDVPDRATEGEDEENASR